MTDKLVDDGLPDFIILAHCQPSIMRNDVLLNTAGIGFFINLVLCVDRAYLADRGNAHADEIAVTVGGIALKVAVQCPGILGNGQVILG